MTPRSKLDPGDGTSTATGPQGRRTPGALADETRPAASRRRGKVLVVAGWIVAVSGILLYCAASLATNSSADLAAVVLDGELPVARLGLLAMGVGTVTWILGSLLDLNRRPAEP